MTRRHSILLPLYAWQLHERDVHAATALAEAIIPPDMMEFLARWPVAREAAKTGLSFSRPRSRRMRVSPLGARITYGRDEYRLRIPLRPRRLKDYLVYEEHKKKSMARKGLEMPDLWYRMPTYTNRNISDWPIPARIFSGRPIRRNSISNSNWRS